MYKFDWLYSTLGNQWIAVTLAQKGRGKIPRDDAFKKNPGMTRLPPRPTDDLAGYEPGTSVTGIQAEAFGKKAHPLGYCASGLTSTTNWKP